LKIKKGKGRVEDDSGRVVLIPVDDDEETEEQRQEVARRKAERLERMRDDPYYIIPDAPKTPNTEVDSIPIVRLTDTPPAPTNTLESRFPSLREQLTPSSEAQSFVIERDGEMPSNAVLKPGQVSTTPAAPEAASSTRASPFPLTDEEGHTSSPDPIKVVRAKKKGTGTGKKKRTAKETLS